MEGDPGVEKKRAEVLYLLEKYFREVEVLSEKDVDEMFGRISDLSPDPEWTDYIFYHKGPELSPEELVEKIFSYRPILL